MDEPRPKRIEARIFYDIQYNENSLYLLAEDNDGRPLSVEQGGDGALKVHRPDNEHPRTPFIKYVSREIMQAIVNAAARDWGVVPDKVAIAKTQLESAEEKHALTKEALADARMVRDRLLKVAEDTAWVVTHKSNA